MGTSVCPIEAKVELTASPIVVTVDPRPVSASLVSTVTQIVDIAQQGRQGPAGASVTTVINITTPTLVWNLAHYLGRYPSVTLIDSGNNVCEADLQYVNENIIVVTFSEPVWGRALLN